MIAAALLLAASAAPPAPILLTAQTRSIAYRECVAAESRRQPAGAKVAEIARGACARARSKLVAEVRSHISYGWAATAKTAGQARRLREHMKAKSEEEVAGFDGKLQAWLEGSAGR